MEYNGLIKKSLILAFSILIVFSGMKNIFTGMAYGESNKMASINTKTASRKLYGGNGSGKEDDNIMRGAETVSGDDFEASLNQEGFPESYKPYLRNLHMAHPTWIFKGARTGMSFNEAVLKESTVGISLVAPTVPEAWKSMEKGAYSFINGRYISYDSGGWVTGTKEIISYYMDPRNFMDERGIFQFMTHGFDEISHTREGVEQLLQGTFMEGGFPEDGFATWSEAIYNIGREEGVSPYVIASIILVEQGVNGIGQCISGTVSGYEGIYNFFNIGAYRAGQMSAVERGLWYAAKSGNYLRPWDSRYKSIKGGANFYGQDYVLKNQNTLYTKKWNVMNGFNFVASHQYMGNIQGADLEASQLKKAYGKIMNTPMTFIIPIFTDMPEKTYKNNEGNNNNFLKNMEVEGYKLDKEFDRYETQYQVKVSDMDSSVRVNCQGEYEGALITGGGSVKLSGKETHIKIKVKATSGAERTYELKVIRDNVPQGNILEEQDEIEKVKSTKIKVSSKIEGTGNDRAIILTWKNLSQTEMDNYNVYVSNSRYQGYGKSPIARLEGNTWEYIYKPLTPGKTYYFKVIGYKKINDIRYKTKQSNKTWKTIGTVDDSHNQSSQDENPSPDDKNNNNNSNNNGNDIDMGLTDKEKEIAEGIKNTVIKAKSQLVNIEGEKPAIDVFWEKSRGFKVDFYQVFRSTKKNSGYGITPFFITETGYNMEYTNTKGLAKGTRYYYKIRGVRKIGDRVFYTQFSNKVYRTV